MPPLRFPFTPSPLRNPSASLIFFIYTECQTLSLTLSPTLSQEVSSGPCDLWLVENTAMSNPGQGLRPTARCELLAHIRPLIWLDPKSIPHRFEICLLFLSRQTWFPPGACRSADAQCCTTQDTLQHHLRV